MNEDQDLRDRLRSLDPAADVPPLPAEDVAGLVDRTVAAGPGRGRHRVAWAAAAAAVAVLAGLGAWWAAGGDGSEAPPAADAPSVTVLTLPPAAPARCMVVTPDLLARQTTAFEGTVTAVEDGTATLEPARWYAGDPTDLVRLDAPSEDAVRLLGAVRFEVGQRYLVAATDGEVALCGISASYSPTYAAMYAEAFGG